MFGDVFSMNCPNCHSARVDRVGQPAQNEVTKRRTGFVYYFVCLNCLHRWDAVTEGGVAPPGVLSRHKKSPLQP